MATGLTKLIVWNEAIALAGMVIAAARHLRGPGALALADQMVRAADSVHSNIAEGYGRGPGRDQVRMYRLAKGSLIEVEGQLRAAARTGRLMAELADPAVGQAVKLSILLTRFVRACESRLKSPKVA